jgi:hypothetical protein
MWYVGCTAVMAFQRTVEWLNIWCFIGGLGFGVQLVTIEACIAEIIPMGERGRAFGAVLGPPGPPAPEAPGTAIKVRGFQLCPIRRALETAACSRASATPFSKAHTCDRRSLVRFGRIRNFFRTGRWSRIYVRLS